MVDLLEIYRRSFDRRGDEGIQGPGEPGTYLGNNTGPIPPKQSPIDAKYEETRENQPEDGTSIDGGSTNDPASGFVQRYNSENAYYTTKEGEVRANISTNDLVQSTKVSGLDVESTSAGVKQGGSGGPINDNGPNGSGFIQTYTPSNPFYTDREGIVRATDGESPLTDTLKVTALDVENPESGVKQGTGGGPNRTSKANGTKSSFIDGGDYKVLRYPTRAKFIDTNDGDEDAGTLDVMTLQQFTPDRTYLEVLADPSLEIEKIIESNNEQPAQGNVPTSIDENIVPDGVGPKINDLQNFNI